MDADAELGDKIWVNRGTPQYANESKAHRAGAEDGPAGDGDGDGDGAKMQTQLATLSQSLRLFQLSWLERTTGQLETETERERLTLQTLALATPDTLAFLRRQKRRCS